jgi:hypothetical protein
MKRVTWGTGGAVGGLEAAGGAVLGAGVLADDGEPAGAVGGDEGVVVQATSTSMTAMMPRR